MRLLICTQAVDSEDPVLGFFVRWIEELSKHYEHVTVICLREGRQQLPHNVSVFTLPSHNRFARARALLKGVYTFRRNYDTVFVHMNQEYVLVAGWLWKLLGKHVYLWRNHYAGSWLTDLAALFCTNIFCTSKYSYTAKYKKTILMPVGIDSERFKPDSRIVRKPHSILFLSRMAPSKRPELLIHALALLAREGHAFTATLVGSPLPQDEGYYALLKEQVRALGLADHVTFVSAVTNSDTPNLYRTHEIFVNTSRSGMFDKTLFEAAACGAVVLAASEDWGTLVGDAHIFTNAATLAKHLGMWFTTPHEKGIPAQATAVSTHSLEALGKELTQSILAGIQ